MCCARCTPRWKMLPSSATSSDKLSRLKAEPEFKQSLNPQLLAPRFTDAWRRPVVLPHQVHLHLADVGDACEPVVDLLKNEPARRALRSCQGHGHFHPLPRPGLRGLRVSPCRNSVDQPQIHKDE